MEERILTRCPKCKTRTLKREGKELVCTQCKGRFSAPEPPSHARHHMTRQQVMEKHEYYEQNREAVLADMESLGIAATVKKWKISYSTLHTLKRRWLKDLPRSRKTAWAKHDYYEKHKDEILNDLKVLGRKATKEKWKLPPSTLTTLLSRWGEPVEPHENGLPALPPWNDEWDPEVQVKWLDIYGKVYGGGK